MAPCYNNNMKNLHYRTQSLPEAVYNNHLLHMAHQEYHQSHLQAVSDKLHGTHQASLAMKKQRAALKRSQTNVCDLVPSVGHHRAPLTAGVYEQFLPPPNLNAIGLPLGASTHQRQRTQSFYMSNHHRSSSLSHHNLHHMGSQHSLCRGGDQMLANYPINHAKALSQRDIGIMNEQKNLSQSWYHRSVPNISQQPSMQQQQSSAQSLTTPLFVDCSVEYDLGDHPPVPANSEPLLSIHPEYVVKARSVNSSPYSMYQSSSNHIRSSKLKGVSPRIEKSETHKSLPDIQAGYSSHRRLHHQQQQQQRYGMAWRAALPRSTPTSCSSSLKVDATRKLSVESRDSGIGMLNSAGTKTVKLDPLVNSHMWGAAAITPQDCDIMKGGQQGETCPSSLPLPHLPHHSEYTQKIISANKRFAFTGEPSLCHHHFSPIVPMMPIMLY